jgi:hypothetical protein
MHKKREISCQTFINVLQKGKIFRVVCCKQLKRGNGIKEMPGKWLNLAAQLRFFSDFDPALFILFPLVITTLRQRMF